MKKRKKSFYVTAKRTIVQDDKSKDITILVYGELWENGLIPGISIQKVGLSRDGKRILEKGPQVINSLGKRYTRTKAFNFGWAICAPDDQFNLEEGIKLAKKRFSLSPLTTQSGNLLTADMISAILYNEVNFISNHLEKFYKKTGRLGVDYLDGSKIRVNAVEEYIEPKPVIAAASKAGWQEVKAETPVDNTFKEGSFLIYSPEKKEEDGYTLRLARVHKDYGDKVLVYWTLTYKQAKNGTFTRSVQSGTDVYIEKKGWRLATKEELELVSKLPDFKKKFIS